MTLLSKLKKLFQNKNIEQNLKLAQSYLISKTTQAQYQLQNQLLKQKEAILLRFLEADDTKNLKLFLNNLSADDALLKLLKRKYTTTDYHQMVLSLDIYKYAKSAKAAHILASVGAQTDFKSEYFMCALRNDYELFRALSEIENNIQEGDQLKTHFYYFLEHLRISVNEELSENELTEILHMINYFFPSKNCVQTGAFEKIIDETSNLTYNPFAIVELSNKNLLPVLKKLLKQFDINLPCYNNSYLKQNKYKAPIVMLAYREDELAVDCVLDFYKNNLKQLKEFQSTLTAFLPETQEVLKKVDNLIIKKEKDLLNKKVLPNQTQRLTQVRKKNLTKI